ncbi:MAG: hypothetical protein LBL90_01940, partial [Prevotellaceae bacterium]|nr:hypothetical protein [Prevotellaceae bacterium]
YTNYRLGIAVNIYSPANITETIIQWDEDRRDVLKTEIYRSGGLTQLRNIWLNEELVWEWEKDDIDKQGFRFIEIRK